MNESDTMEYNNSKCAQISYLIQSVQAVSGSVNSNKQNGQDVQIRQRALHQSAMGKYKDDVGK